MVGNIPALVNPHENTTASDATVAGEILYIPLEFWFCRNPGLNEEIGLKSALPPPSLCARVGKQVSGALHTTCVKLLCDTVGTSCLVCHKMDRAAIESNCGKPLKLLNVVESGEKVCITCQQAKVISDFAVRTDTCRRRNQCDDCRNRYVSQYKQRQRSNGSLQKRVVLVSDEGYKECRICHEQKLLAEFPSRPTQHGHRHECKACTRSRLDAYYKEVYNDVRNDRKKKTDIQYRLLCNHRNYVYKCLAKFKNKCDRSAEYLQCSLPTLKAWLEWLWFPVYFSSIILIHRFIQHHNLSTTEYQGIRESLCWLRDKLRHGKNLTDEEVVNLIISANGQSAAKLLKPP
jgi:hypothetical protein